eukprot:gb/GEZN01008173.1/.p1 GENE.gb/GEZN01008173.1/~~gb/GEZN01008173.1/.p1  ORF type:complete len:296 (+),score=66.50 gb/GEZN01008173.1/:44-931(+)
MYRDDEEEEDDLVPMRQQPRLGLDGSLEEPGMEGEEDTIVGTKRSREDARARYVEQSKHFWIKQMESLDGVDFKNLKPQLPLARIKKIMKSDEDVRMISAEAPVLFSKACELFILDLTMRAWSHTDQSKRRTLQRNDVAEAIAADEMFDFLIDVVPVEETRYVAEPGSDALLQTFQDGPGRQSSSASSSSSNSALFCPPLSSSASSSSSSSRRGNAPSGLLPLDSHSMETMKQERGSFPILTISQPAQGGGGRRSSLGQTPSSNGGMLPTDPLTPLVMDGMGGLLSPLNSPSKPR